MRRLAGLLLLLLLLAPGLAGACFGPRLYLGIEPGPAAEVLAEVVLLYVQEKTGVESIRVPLAAGEGAAALTGDRVDLAVAGTGLPGELRMLAVAGMAELAVGERPREELQFTTVVPALRKLAGLLGPADLRALLDAVGAGTPPAAAAGELLRERRWI